MNAPLRPPDTCSSRSPGAQGRDEINEGLQPDERRQSNPGTPVAQCATKGASRFPGDTAVLGLILDSEHVGDVSALIGSIPNTQASKLLASWRRESDRFPFCVIGGELHRRNGGLVGGLAQDWRHAQHLLAYCRARFDELAASGTGFSSVWGLHLSDERRDEVLAIIAATMATAGSA